MSAQVGSLQGRLDAGHLVRSASKFNQMRHVPGPVGSLRCFKENHRLDDYASRHEGAKVMSLRGKFGVSLPSSHPDMMNCGPVSGVRIAGLPSRGV